VVDATDEKSKAVAAIRVMFSRARAAGWCGVGVLVGLGALLIPVSGPSSHGRAGCGH